jgi:hypothetical protein
VWMVPCEHIRGFVGRNGLFELSNAQHKFQGGRLEPQRDSCGLQVLSRLYVRRKYCFLLQCLPSWSVEIHRRLRPVHLM